MKEINYTLSLEEVAKIFSIEVAKETDTNAWKKYTEKFSEIKRIENLYIKKSSLFSNFDFETELGDYHDITKGVNYELNFEYCSQSIYLRVFSPKPLDEKQVRMMLLILYARKEKEIEKYTFVNNLKWEYNKENVFPQEYILFKCNTERENELKNFADYIHKNAKKEKINDVYFTCLHFGDYYYWIQDFNNCLCRTYFYDSKIKDISRFVKSSDFEYKKCMSLSDVHTQLLDNGYNWAFDCEFNGKRFDVCANGHTYGQEEDKEYLNEECEEIEKRIKEIYKNYPDKANFNIDKLLDELNKDKNFRHCSSRIGINLKIKI